jgi:uncharacterized protein YPO0396
MNARIEDLRADMNARDKDLRTDINVRFAEGRADLNKRLDDFRGDINQRLQDIAARLREIEGDVRYLRDKKVVETIERHEGLIAEMQRHHSEMSHRILAIEQMLPKKVSKKMPEVEQSTG